MKKILIPVETKDRLPDKEGLYRTDHGFTAFKNGKFKSGRHGDVLVWFEEASEEEYLISKLIRNQELEQKIFNYFSNEHDIMLMEDDFNTLLWIIQEHLKSKQ